MNEFDCLKEVISKGPIESNYSNFLLVKTTVNYFGDFEYRLNTNLSSAVRKFGHSGWNEMKPLIVGIKCYLNDLSGTGSADVLFTNRKNENRVWIDTVDVSNETWHTFKYPLLEAYHTETRISLSQNIKAYTFAILNCSDYVRQKHGTNYFPAGYTSYESEYGEFNKALVYVTKDGKEINPNPELNELYKIECA